MKQVSEKSEQSQSERVASAVGNSSLPRTECPSPSHFVHSHDQSSISHRSRVRRVKSLSASMDGRWWSAEWVEREERRGLAFTSCLMDKVKDSTGWLSDWMVLTTSRTQVYKGSFVRPLACGSPLWRCYSCIFFPLYRLMYECRRAHWLSKY